jgi:hypothetical protein
VEVFVNHPAHAKPGGYWRGDAAPPRVAQWRDALMASYRLPPDAGLSFTHAHVPLHACDAHALRDNWAFVRRGDAYLALTASTPLSWVAATTGARRELRAPGPRTVWLCQMGRRADDGDFAAFQARVLAQAVDFAAPTLRWTTPQGDELALAPEAPLRVNGQPVTLPAARHYATPFGVVDAPAEQMDIRVGSSLLRLDFT